MTSTSRLGRGKNTMQAAWRLMFQPRSTLDHRAWTTSMSWMLVAGLVAIIAAHFLDDAATLYVRSSHAAWIRYMADVTNVGKSQWYLVPAGLVFLGIAFLDWETRKRPHRARLAFLFGQAGYAFLAVAFAGIIGDIIKFLVGRARPKLFDAGGSMHFQPFTEGYNFNSFPSGHSTTMGAVAVVLILWFPKLRIPLFLLCALAATTRIAARAHYPSDVVAGFLLGSLYALYLARWLARRRIVFRFRESGLLPVPRFSLFARPSTNSSRL